MKRPGTRIRIVPLLVALVVGLAPFSAADVRAASEPSPNDWLGWLNLARATGGLPPVTMNKAWNPGQTAHARYTVINDGRESFHFESPDLPGYSEEGDLAARTSVLLSDTSTRAERHTAAYSITSWLATPLHGRSILHPALCASAFDHYRDLSRPRIRYVSALNTIRGLEPNFPGIAEPYTWPGHGSAVPLTSFEGENPDPLWPFCPYSLPTGLIVWAHYPSPPQGTRASLVRDDGAHVETCEYGHDDIASHPELAGSEGRFGNYVFLIPREPLARGHRYTARFTTTDGTVVSTFRITRDEWRPATREVVYEPFEPPPLGLERACPDGQVPEDAFVDVSLFSVHEQAIDCVVWWEVARGVAAGKYAPGRVVTRAQMATFLTKVLELSGAEVPLDPPDAFPDDEGSVHEPSINRLAAMGIVAGVRGGSYRPENPVRRDQMATFLVRAYSERFAEPVDSGLLDAFDDDAENVHELNINWAAYYDLVDGVTRDAYAPHRNVTRDQMGTFLARLLDRMLPTSPAYPPS